MNNDWKKTLKTFLKGSGKSLMKDFTNKSILISLTGGDAFVVESEQVDSFMEGKGIKSVLEQNLHFKPTENNTMKAYFKEASGKGKVNLIVYNQQEDVKQRDNLFVLNDLHQFIEERPDESRRVLGEEYRHIAGLGNHLEHLSAKIGKILMDHGFPLAFLVVFSDNSERLNSMSKKCSNPGDTFRPSFKLSKESPKNPIQDLFDQLRDVEAEDYCKVYQKNGFDHAKISNLYRYVVAAMNAETGEDQKKAVNDFVMACLKLDVNNPKMYIQNKCGDHCQRQCQAITEFLNAYIN